MSVDATLQCVRSVTGSSHRPVAWMVCPTFGHATEPWLWRQAATMSSLDVRIVCWARQNPDRFPYPLEKVSQLSFQRLPRGRLQWWLQRLRTVHTGNFYGTVGAERRAFLELLERDRPRVILCQFGPTMLKVLPAALRARVPVVGHFHGVDLSHLLRDRWYVWSLRRSFAQAEGFVVVANYMRQWLEQAGCPPRKIHHIPCGVPIDEHPVSEHVGDQPCRFVAVGRFVDKKAPDLTIRAFAACLDGGAEARLIMLGDGPLLESCRRLAADLGVADRIEFTGVQPRERVRDEMARAGAFVQHSVTAPDGDREGWPVAIAEAAACGLPIVATMHAEIPNQVHERVSGFLVPEHDWRGMGERMLTLARDPDLRIRMGREARARMEACDLKHQVALLEGVLLDCAERRDA